MRPIALFLILASVTLLPASLANGQEQVGSQMIGVSQKDSL